MIGEVKLSIVIPTRNREKELTNLLKSLNHTSTGIDEIIIVDSSDKKSQNLNFNNDFKIVYHHTSTRSAAIQRNIGISLINANTEFIAFLDDDVLVGIDYFKELIDTLIKYDAIGVSGIAVNSKELNTRSTNKLSTLYRRIFLLGSRKEGIILNSGVNIPVTNCVNQNYIVQAKWLIGCAMWDFQRIKDLRFDSRLFGQSLGEDVLFSLKASRLGSLFVNLNTHLEHTESDAGRPNQFEFYRMWVRNRYFIVCELVEKKYHIDFHWCNLGKSIILFASIIKNPSKSISGLAGLTFGYFDLIRRKDAN